MSSNRLRIIILLVVLALGASLLVALADRTLQGDPWDWLQTARTLAATGDTGFQHRNILYGYVLAIPLFLGLDPITFGLAVSGAALLVSAALLYTLNLRYTSPPMAGFVSLLFILSYPFLRYATQVFSDIPTVALIVAMVCCHFRYVQTERPGYLLGGYVLASAAASMRYAAGFFSLAFLYFVWISRRAWRWHLVGVALAVIPYVPQLIYNMRYLGGAFSVSYTSVHPIFGWQFFFKDLGSGHEWQLPGYLRYMFLDFRGLFALLTPAALVGALHARRFLGRPLALYLILFILSFIVLLPFYSYFSNRYAIPAIIPCFVWLPLGFDVIGRWWARRRPRRVAWLAYVVALALIAYSMFEISFQVIASSRALHELRERVFAQLDRFIQEGDVVYTIDSVQPFALRGAVRPQAIGAAELTPAMLAQRPGRPAYVVWTPDLVTSEGGSWQLSIRQVRDRLTPIYQDRIAAVPELLLYRTLRALGRSAAIPFEEWTIFQVADR